MQAFIVFDRQSGAVINIVVGNTAPSFDQAKEGLLRIKDANTIKTRDLSQAVVRGGRLDFRV